jgi:myo-inositol 2-dehydrogenase/D-chiro-inositol 1-dehydrogenase
MTLRIAVIGAGRIGKLHAENIAGRVRNAQLVSVTDVNAAAAQALGSRLHVPVAAGYQEILNDPDVDAVLIGTSTDTHAAIAIDAARAGKHIFCEKPIDFDLSRIDQVLAAVETAGVKFQVGFNRRFDPSFRRVRDAVVNGEVGEPHMIHVISRDPAPPPAEYIRASGGMFFDMTIHDFDMVRYLTGSEVEEIYTMAAVRVDPRIGELGDVDTAVLTMRFVNGVIGTIDNSRRAVYGYDQRVEVFGSGGSIATDNVYPNQARLATATSVQRDLPLNFFLERYTESFVAEMNEFVDAVLNNQPVPVGGADGRAPVVMGMAARRSHDLGRPVKLSEIEG